MSRTNDITLFSNGIGHFRRVFAVGADSKRISIPFKKDHIGDVAASLQVFGAVRLVEPPCFTPQNSNATHLRIDRSHALVSLLKSLSGARCNVRMANTTFEGVVNLGVDEATKVKAEEIVVQQFLVILLGNGTIQRVDMEYVKNVEFIDEAVKTEIAKALKNNFQDIKPDSALVDLTLQATGKEETEAIVQYTIPVAAWKMRYAIRQDDNGALTLEGAAVVDNCTDEDWKDFRLSVVTGNPISFDTDIATVSLPQRRKIKLVDGDTQGNIAVEESYRESVVACAAAAGGGASKGARGIRSAGFSKMSMANYADFGLESADAEREVALNDEMYSAAQAPGVDSKEVGDFCIFTSKEPVTILARMSAVVPMFSVPLSKAGVVLYYNENYNQRRAYRAIKFRNETEYSLGKGKTLIYNQGTFSGECVLEPTKPGENRMLPHCMENGVKIYKETKSTDYRRVSLKISDSSATEQICYSSVTTYKLVNIKNEEFKLAIEHSNVLKAYPELTVETSGVDVKEREKLASNDGYRFYLELKPSETVVLTVTEVAMTEMISQINNANWLVSQVVNRNSVLSQDPQIKVCLEIAKQLDDVREEETSLSQRRQLLSQQGDRIRANLAAIKDGMAMPEWVHDLHETELEIRKIDKEDSPALKAKRLELLRRQQEEIAKITVRDEP